MKKSVVWGLLVVVIRPMGCHAVRKTRLTWVNGIAYGLHHMEEGRQGISKIFGGKPVIYCYNPTSMSHDDDRVGYLGDLTQAGTQKLGRVTKEVDVLVKHLRESVAEVGKRGRVVHIAHSQGALITSLAAKKLSPLEMSQIEVLAFGGAVALRKTPETPFARVVNYYSVNDPLLLMVPTAAQALRSGLVADEEFCFLAPRVGDPIRDHDLLGPTYRTALGWEGIRFQQTYQSILYRSTRPVLIFALFVIQQLHLMIQAIIKQTIRFLLWVWAIHEPWLEGGKALAKRYIVVPTLQVVLFVYAWLQEVIRLAKREDKYVQVQVGKQQDQP